MKNTEVPQEDGGLLEGKFKTLKYAIDEDGNYVEVQSIGWGISLRESYFLFE